HPFDRFRDHRGRRVSNCRRGGICRARRLAAAWRENAGRIWRHGGRTQEAVGGVGTDTGGSFIHTTAKGGVAMKRAEYLTLAEIYERFDSEWVLLKNPKTDRMLNIKGGTLLWHSKDRDEVHRKAIELKPRHMAIFYTGTIPKGTAVILAAQHNMQ